MRRKLPLRVCCVLIAAAVQAPPRSAPACSPGDFRGSAPASGAVSVSGAGAPAPPWSEDAPLPAAVQEVAVAELDGSIYVVGGFRGDQSIADDVAVYDPDSDSWVYAPPLPTVIHHTTATVVDGRLYVIGGWADLFATPLATVYEFDPDLGTWTTKTPMPTPRGSPAAAVLDGKIYVAGGWPDQRSTDFAVYDPALDQWQVLPPMPTGRNHMGLAAADGYIFAVGGRTSIFAGVGNVDAVEAYDPVSEQWAGRAPLPRARGGLAVTSVGSFVFAFGGEGNPENPDGVFEDADVYDPQADLWRSLAPMPTPRHGIGAAPVAGRIHIPGGGPVQNFGVTDVHEILDAVATIPGPVPGPGAIAAALASLAVACAGVALGGSTRLRHGRPANGSRSP